VVPTTAKDGNLGILLMPLREEPDSTAIFCDIDGTLAPIVERPGEAGVPAGAREALEALADRYELVGCVSGRRAVEARELVGLDALVYIGNHGFERLFPGEREARLDPGLHDHAEAAARFAEQLDFGALEAAGLRSEDKGPIRAFHWRGAPDEGAAEATARDLASEAVGRNLVPHWGRKVLEIRPAVEVNKGTALAELLEERRLDNALYGGDDRTDIDAFVKLHAMCTTGDLEAAVCVGVASPEGPRELIHEADVVVEGTAAFIAMLRLLL
jgi:trehalose 6-phosphate phosphatase